MISTPIHKLIWMMLSLAVVLCVGGEALSQTTVFTYQGKLSDSGNAANGSYDMQFKLFDTVTVGAGVQQGGTITRPAVQVTDGIFTVQLDFGAPVFPGADRFIEIALKQAGGPTYTTLAPRQQVSSTPYAIRSRNSVTADGLSVACVNCVLSSQIQGVAGSQVLGPISVSSIPPGSSNYIQNTNSQQANSNFNISGAGAANSFNATTNYRIGGASVLSNAGGSNLFAGVGAGSNNTGSSNAFFGANAGLQNSSGSNNAFYGSNSGTSNTNGQTNAFFGSRAGSANSAGSQNTFIGFAAGELNTGASFSTFVGAGAGGRNTGPQNTFVGALAGSNNTTGINNAFFGAAAGNANTTASHSAFFGFTAGELNTACCNSFFGARAGAVNTDGTGNSFFGYNAGAANTSAGNNSYFGYSAGAANTTAGNNSYFGFQAGSVSTGAGNAFFGSLAGAVNTTGYSNSFFGYQAGAANTTAINNSFFGQGAGFRNTQGHDNTLLGKSAGVNITTANNNTIVGSLAGQFGNGANNTFLGFSAGSVNSGSGNTYLGYLAGGTTTMSNATAIGANAFAQQSNTVVLGSINGLNGATADTDVGIGTAAPDARLHVKGNLLVEAPAGGTSSTASLALSHPNISPIISQNWSVFVGSVQGYTPGLFIKDAITGQIPMSIHAPDSSFSEIVFGGRVLVPLSSGGSTNVCTGGPAGAALAFCSSSLRYKTDVEPFGRGLALVNRLNPIAFRWKGSNLLDLGFGAEDVAAVEPLLVTRNEKGEVEGVKYDRITAALVNAVKEQQQQIAAQQKQIDELSSIKAENNQLKAQIAAILARLEQR